MSMNVVIATEGGNDIGFGHLTRCVSLYQAFEEKGITPKLVVNGDKSIKDLFTDINYSIFDWLGERERIFNIINGADIAIIDSYLADLEFYKKISDIVKTPVYMDDNKRIDYPRGIVINGSVCAEEISYPDKGGSVYLVGAKYAPLRKEFWHIPKKTINKKIKNIMVTFGGDDSRNLTPRILESLTVHFSELTKKVIIGKGFRNLGQIEKLKDKSTVFMFYPDAEKIKQIMLESDIALSLAGQTLYELARIGVPTIAIVVADNQLYNAKSWQKTKFIKYAGCYSDSQLFDNIKYCLDNLEDYKVRKTASEMGRKHMDGLGGRRIVERIREFL